MKKQITDDIELRLFDLIQTNRESIDLSLNTRESGVGKLELSGATFSI